MALRRRHQWLQQSQVSLEAAILCASGGCGSKEYQVSKKVDNQAQPQQPEQGGPQDQRVIQIASEFARQQGKKVENYRVRSVTVEGATARVLFHNDQGRPGDHFTILVDVDSGKADRLIPGR